MNQESKKEKFTFKAGTRLAIGNDVITLTEDATLYFDGAENERLMVGMLLHSNNLEGNREQLKYKYNGFGMPLPVEAQIEDGDDPEAVNSFIASLTPGDADMFGVGQRRNAILDADDQLKKSKLREERKAAEEAEKRAEEVSQARIAEREAEIQKQMQIANRDLALKTIEHNDQNLILAATKEEEIKSDIVADEPKVERLTEESQKAAEKAAEEAEKAKKTTKSNKK